MNTRDVAFTMWFGGFCLAGSNVFVGMAKPSDKPSSKACESVYIIRPTMDAEFEVVSDDATANMVRRNS